MNASQVESETTTLNGDTIHLTMLHTNDMHAHLEPMARLSTLSLTYGPQALGPVACGRPG